MLLIYNLRLHVIKTILAKYTSFFLGLMKALGMWGPFTIAAVDASFFGLPLDPVVAGYVWSDHHRFWIYPIMAAAGSALGSLILYAVGRGGGEVFLAKRMSKQRLEKIRDRFEKQEFLALMIPSMAPPPFPFKLFILSAGVFDMKPVDFLLAIFVGRLIRFFTLAFLVLEFGPEVVSRASELFRNHLGWTLAAIAGVVIVAAVIVLLMRRPAEEIIHEVEEK